MASLNPEGSLGIYLCDVTFPAVLIAGFFTRGKSNLFLFSQEYFLFPGILMFFYHSFHR